MRDDEFEWDDAKALANQARHGISFNAARLVFEDPFALDWLDDREEYGEIRHSTIGLVVGRLLYVAYTERGSRIRIISARGVEPLERKAYHEGSD